ncbi:MAG: aldo/keto reductase [Tissierellia bacterium]|nr:aldo/keto reductase [Tissierellia bacterium]
MKMRRLGKTKLMVSVIGFGGIPIQHVDEKAAREIFQALAEAGINFVDTGRGYTTSESLIGRALKDHRREDFIIATKSMARTYEGIRRDVETSLKQLDVEQIELYQFHNVRYEEEMDTIFGEGGAYQGIKEYLDQGVIKHLGITSHNRNILIPAMDTGVFDTIQFPFNAVENQAIEQFQYAIEKDLGVIIMKPLAGGALINKGLALRYAMEQPFVTTLIPGMNSVEQVMENAAVGNHFTPLNDEEKALLNQEVEELGDKFCRRCGYCAPCTVGIDIPTCFLMEGYYTRYDLKEWAIDRYSAIHPSAGDCIQCGDCEKRCPYDLPIINMLERVDQLFSK